MDRIEYLQDQASRAERLSRSITDTLTVDRLQSFAAECRRQIKLLGGETEMRARKPSAELRTLR